MQFTRKNWKNRNLIIIVKIQGKSMAMGQKYQQGRVGVKRKEMLEIRERC